MDISTFELERGILSQKAERACQNVIGRFCLYRSACRHEDIMALWAEMPDVRIEAPWGVYDGTESIRRFLRETQPEHGDADGRKGVLDVDAINTPDIIVARDVKTARGIWMSQGLRTRMKNDEASCIWRWTKLGVDFIEENGRWKLWHMAIYPLLETDYETAWYDMPKLTQDSFASYTPDRKPTARSLWSFHKDNVYPMGHPAEPSPYDNFEIDVGYGY